MTHLNLTLTHENYESIRKFIQIIIMDGKENDKLCTEQSIDTYIHNGIHNYMKIMNKEHTLVSETVLNVENDTLHECALQIVTQGFKYSNSNYKSKYKTTEFILPNSFVKQTLLSTDFKTDERYLNVLLLTDEETVSLYFLYSLGIQI